MSRSQSTFTDRVPRRGHYTGSALLRGFLRPSATVPQPPSPWDGDGARRRVGASSIRIITPAALDGFFVGQRVTWRDWHDPDALRTGVTTQLLRRACALVVAVDDMDPPRTVVLSPYEVLDRATRRAILTVGRTGKLQRRRRDGTTEDIPVLSHGGDSDDDDNARG